jgi:hypothetical protein
VTREELVGIAAEAILNARGARRGVPAISNVAKFVPPHVLADAVEDAEAALERVGALELYEAALATRRALAKAEVLP